MSSRYPLSSKIDKMDVQIVDAAWELVSNAMKDNDASHDVEHVRRVVRLARFLAEKEDITDPDTLEIIELASILHDLCDYKYRPNSDTSELDHLFESHNYPPIKKDRILHVIKNIGYKDELKRMATDEKSYKKVYNHTKFVERDPTFHTPELCIVQDADRLEALGAIGISRCLFFTAARGGLIHDPDAIVYHNLTAEEYAARSKDKSEGKGKKQAASTHFHEKLFKLQYLMKTGTGREMAHERTKIMHLFIASLYEEWMLKDEPYDSPFEEVEYENPDHE